MPTLRASQCQRFFRNPMCPVFFSIVLAPAATHLSQMYVRVLPGGDPISLCTMCCGVSQKEQHRGSTRSWRDDEIL